MKKSILLFLIIISFNQLINCSYAPDIPYDQLKYISINYNPPQDPVGAPVMPSQPIISVQTGDKSLIISWPNCSNANSYNIYISSDGINYGSVMNVSSPYTILGLVNGIKYHVIVSSQNQNGETMSSEVLATPGIIDNLNGTIFIVNTGLTWSKCSQKDAIGNDTYNALNNDCSNGIPARLIYCMTRFGCDDGISLNGTGVSEVYSSCAGRGIGWMAPTSDDLMTFNQYYSSAIWSDIVNDWYYPRSGWNQPQPYGGYVWVNPIGGYFASSSFVDPSTQPAYVICVK